MIDLPERRVTERIRPLFSLGQVVARPGALETLANANVMAMALVARHVSGDWGDLCEEDKQLNQEALRDGGRIFSSYTLVDQSRIWVITEADRSATTLLLPDDY